MKSRYPVKEIKRLNWSMSLTSAFYLFMFISMFDKKGINQEMIFLIITVFLSVFFLGLINLAILLFLEKVNLSHSPNHRTYQIALSVLITSFVFLGLTLTAAIIDHRDIDALSYVFLLLVGNGLNSLILILQRYTIIREDKIKSDLENSNLRTANAESANQLLRQQIQPHFLFNALNALKSLYKKDPEAAETYLVRLSDFLRASLSNNNEKRIPLKEELKLCSDYLEMQKIRFGEALIFSFEIPEKSLEEGFVPSFSLQPLLENAIKHNECTEESPLRISVKQEGDWLRVTNNIQIKKSSEQSVGSGLANLSKRYRLISGDELIIEANEEVFSVLLKILKHENSHH